MKLSILTGMVLVLAMVLPPCAWSQNAQGPIMIYPPVVQYPGAPTMIQPPGEPPTMVYPPVVPYPGAPTMVVPPVDSGNDGSGDDDSDQ